MLRSPNCPFGLFVGTKKLVKRRELEEYISEKLVICPCQEKFTKYLKEISLNRLRKGTLCVIITV